MKQKLFTLPIILLLILGLTIPIFADAAEDNASHWSQSFLDELAINYTLDSLFMDKNLDEYITPEDFQLAVRLIIDGEYDHTPDSVLRETIVYEFTQLWANKTGKDLDKTMTIKMRIYADTDKIDAKYNRAITVAYMKDIARGRGQGIFDPKTNTTYGELATLVYCTQKAIENTLQEETPSIVGGKFETRASYEIKDEKIIFDFELFSHYAEPRELTFSSGQQFELTITDEASNEVYRYSDGRSFTMALVYKTINPGESFKWQDQWDMTDKDDIKLESGNYNATIWILASHSEDETIDDSPLTAAIDFSID